MSKYVTAADRIKVFRDTQAWIKSDPVLAASVNNAKENTKVYWEDVYPSFQINGVCKESVEVTPERTFEAAMRLRKEDAGAKIAVLNFANAFTPGGGVTIGASAQEECLCRCSTLYPLLYRRSLRDTFYKHHHTLNTPKASDALIYTEGVVICKTDESYPKRMRSEDWVSVDVITMAAPDLRQNGNQYAELIGNGTYMNHAELFGYHVKRAIHMLTVAAHKGADMLVLGAFGCGAFENDPAVVAKAYKTALEEFPKVFKKVVFAVYCRKENTENYDVFKKVLGDVHVQSEDAVIDKEAMDERALKSIIHQYKSDPSDMYLSILVSVLRNVNIWVPYNVEMSLPDLLSNGKASFFPVFSTIEDMGEYGDHFGKVQMSFLQAIQYVEIDKREIAGIVINAFGEDFIVPREGFEAVKQG